MPTYDDPGPGQWTVPEQVGNQYRSGAYSSLLPAQVRDRRFRPAGFGRRGLDPEEVYAFLGQVAADLAALHEDLAHTRQENARVMDALRRWQSEQARVANERIGRR